MLDGCAIIQYRMNGSHVPASDFLFEIGLVFNVKVKVKFANSIFQFLCQEVSHPGITPPSMEDTKIQVDQSSRPCCKYLLISSP